MKKISLNLTLSLIGILFCCNLLLADTYPKREIRSTWLAKLFCVAFLYFILSAPAATAQATATPIKREMRSMWIAAIGVDFGSSTLKSVVDASVNASTQNNYTSICFHVRPMADALYKSNLAPWSSYASGTRGKAPGYDPLQYTIDKAHAAGIEVYAWLNPYRWQNGASLTFNTSYDQEWKANGWAMNNGNQTVLNPSIPEVRAHIVAIVKEIIENYAVDGIIFDDYFYPNGGYTTGSDAVDYLLWQNSKSGLSFGAWRRDNINKMVQEVYEAIQSIKPDVRFGVAPAGIAGANAGEYGFPDRPANTDDWQYNQIYSDPLAWFHYQSLDFVSPQIYWSRSQENAPYEALAQWWSQCAGMSGRHMYVSQGPYQGFSNEENVAQIDINRKYTENNAPGFIMFSQKSMTDNLNEYILANATQKKALQPKVTWHSDKVHAFTAPTNAKKSGSLLTWDAQSYSNRIVKYSVYAVPTSVDYYSALSNDDDGLSSKYLLGVTYTNSFTIPSGKTSNYWYAICVYDGFGNEWSPAFVNLANMPALENLEVTLSAPADGIELQATTQSFSWASNTTATFTFEISSDASFTSTVYGCSTQQTYESYDISNLSADKTYYWRVKAEKTGYESVTSSIRSFTVASTNGGTNGTLPVKDSAGYTDIEGFTIESQWLYSVNTSNFPATLKTNKRSMTALNGKVYVSQQGGYLLEFDGKTGSYIRKIELSGDCRQSSTISTLKYISNDVFVDGAGHLCVSNMTINMNTEQLTVCTVNIATGATTRIFESTLHSASTTERIDYAAAYGDVTASGGQIWAAGSKNGTAVSNTVYRWTRNSSGTWTEATTSIGSYYASSGTVSDNGSAPRIMPISSTQFVLDGQSSAPSLYTFKSGGTAIANDSFANNTDLAPNGSNYNGMCTATLNGIPLFIYTSDHNPNKFNIVTNPSNWSYATMKKLWTVPSNGFGTAPNSYISSQSAAINNADGSVSLFLYVPENGLACYLLKTVPTTIPAATLLSPVSGAVVNGGFNFSWEAIEGATYTLEISSSSTFEDIDFSTTTTSNSYNSADFALTSGNTYYWRVKADKEGFETSVSNIESFETWFRPIVEVTLISPLNESNLPYDNYTFSWSSDEGATYTFEISSDKAFSTIIATTTTTDKEYSFDAKTLDELKTYYWRVKGSISGYEDGVSEIWSFTAPEAPSWWVPEIYQPASGAIVIDDMSFVVSYTYADETYLEISTTQDFSDMYYSGSSRWVQVEDTETGSGIWLQYTMPISYFTNGTYYWRVHVAKKGYKDGYTEIRTFKVSGQADGSNTYSMVRENHEYELANVESNYITLTNIWIRSDLHGNGLGQESIGTNNRGFCARKTDNTLYISGRSGSSAYLDLYNAATGEYKKRLNLSGTNGTTISSSTSACNSVDLDNEDNLYIYNAVAWGASPIQICSVDPTTGYATEEVSITNPGVRIDHCDVVGDVTSNYFYVFAASKANNIVYRWTVQNGSASTPETMSISSFYPATDSDGNTIKVPGTAPRIIAIDESTFYLDGSGISFTLYEWGNGTPIGSFAQNESIAPKNNQGNGGAYFTHDGVPYLIYAIDDYQNATTGYKFNVASDIYQPGSFSKMTKRWTIPQESIGHTEANGGDYGALVDVIQHSSSALTRAANPDVTNIYIYVPGNGIAAYTMRSRITTDVDGIPTEKIKITNNNGIISFGTIVEEAALYTMSGSVIALGHETTCIESPMTSGIYLLQIKNNGTTITEKIIIK